MKAYTFCIKSMGCKSNQYEGAVITNKMTDSGFIEVEKIQDADYFILNSCSVTQKSDNESLYILRNAKNINKSIKTILTGCLAQLEVEKLSKLEYIDYVFGNDDKFNIPEYLNNNSHVIVTDIMDKDEFNYQLLENYNKTRFSIKIQDGCNNRCSYCVIPFARGMSRSANEDFIVNQINAAKDKGFKEIVLTGIHIGQWGKEWDKSIIDLLKSIELNTNIPRYRLGSLNPLEINDELLSFLKDSSKFCPHFHLSLQSACNNTLKSMNRPYTVEFYLDQIEKINSLFPNVFMGSDIIAGFVGETDDDFNTTITNLKKSKLSKIHVFPYSIRKNTLAEKMKGHLPDNVKQSRADTIKLLSKEKYIDFINKNINTNNEVLIEKKLSKLNNSLKGMTRNYLEVNITDFNGNYSDYLNTIKNVTLVSYKNNIISAKIID